jgi:glycosyltransferase involved in cell wall biosynthesis
MPPKVGVMIPTYKRPDLLRQAVLQWVVQTVKPDLLCIHQNGSAESYEWAIEDLKPLIEIKFIHVPTQTKQHMWYALPLSHLLAERCDVFLWADHDDIYYRNHVETKITQLEGHDVTLSDMCGVLFVDHLDYKYNPPAKFHVHAPGGMSSSMAFNRKFAESLMMDLVNDTEYYYSDNVVAHVTMPKHDKHLTEDLTTVYVSHKGSHSSHHWAEGIFSKAEPT